MLTLFAFAFGPHAARADQGGLSFWLPGVFGSLAAVPGVPGWGFTTIYLHLEESATGGKNFVQGTSIVAGLDAHSNVVAYGPTYVFAAPVLGGQASVSLFNAAGRVDAGISATLTGPMGNAISGSKTDDRTTFADVFWQGALKWNQGVNNTMVYATGNIPSGTYDPTRLANLSFGWVAVDGGAGYTYFDQKTGHEFSIVGGLTYNLMNSDTRYQNGIDSHIDWAASQFLSKTFFAGVAGYYFQQLTADSGPGAKLGPFKSRVLGIGPQVGFIFPVGQGLSGCTQPEGLQGPRYRKPAAGLDRLGCIGDLAGAAERVSHDAQVTSRSAPGSMHIPEMIAAIGNACA
jgi:hypothetical protein